MEYNKEENRVELDKEIYVKYEKGALYLHKDGKKTSLFFKNYYVTKPGSEKPETIEEAEKRVGKDVYKLDPETIFKIGKELGAFVPITEKDLDKAVKSLMYAIFDPEFDELDEFSYKLTLSLTKQEYDEVKDLFRYDSELEEYLTKDPLEATKRLMGISPRFEEVGKKLGESPMLMKDFYRDFRSYLECYYNKNDIVDTLGFGDFNNKEYEDFLKKYKVGKFETKSSVSSINGYNLETVQVASCEDGSLAVQTTGAAGIDDWCGEIVIAKQHRTTDNPKTLLKIGSALNLMGGVLYEHGYKRRVWDYSKGKPVD